jgi:hypothetical protein
MKSYYVISAENKAAAGAEIKPMTTDNVFAKALARSFSPQSNGTIIIYMTPELKSIESICEKYAIKSA